MSSTRLKGRYDVYVRSFPDGAGKWQVSVNGGAWSRWRSDGKELYYRQGGATLMGGLRLDRANLYARADANAL